MPRNRKHDARILQYVGEHPDATVAEIMRVLTIEDYDSGRRILRDLVNRGLLRRHTRLGLDKKHYYNLASTPVVAQPAITQPDVSQATSSAGTKRPRNPERNAAILAFLAEKHGATLTQMAAKFVLGKAAVAGSLSELLENGLVVRWQQPPCRGKSPYLYGLAPTERRTDDA